MKITTIKYTEEFNYHGASQWVGLGAEIIEGEDVKKNLYELQRKAREFFYESSNVAEKQVPVVNVEKKGEVFNQEWEDIKRQLLSFDNVEAAQLYLNSTSYSMTIEAKQIINTLKSKNEKK